MKLMNIKLNKLIFVTALICNTMIITAQEEKDTRPVPETFNATTLINTHTNIVPAAKGLEFVLQHRFGSFDNGIEDIFGIYGASNIRMGFNYGIADNLMLAFQTEKNNKLQEFQVKYNILNQTRSGSMPVTLTYFSNMAISSKDETEFGSEFKSIHRLSYFHQLIISRKFSDKLSVLVAPGFVHYNVVDSVYKNQKLSITAGGKYNVYNNISLLCEYNKSFYLGSTESYQEDKTAKDDLSFAAEILSGTHTFQIVFAHSQQLVMQNLMMYNENDLSTGWCLGFNLTVRFY